MAGEVLTTSGESGKTSEHGGAGRSIIFFIVSRNVDREKSCGTFSREVI